jgi:hypothetical protein
MRLLLLSTLATLAVEVGAGPLKRPRTQIREVPVTVGTGFGIAIGLNA